MSATSHGKGHPKRPTPLATGAVDITMQYVGPSILQLDAGKPIIVLAGKQSGCDEARVARHSQSRGRLRRRSRARFLVENGYTEHYDYALQALREIPYNKWRLYDHEDTVRFYSLRLREGGIIKSSPQKIIAQGTDWQFLNELKRD
jgi:hypothetical protein